MNTCDSTKSYQTHPKHDLFYLNTLSFDKVPVQSLCDDVL